MARSHKVHVDTSALIAFLDGSDSYHSSFRLLFSDPPPLTTSALVIAEGHAWFLRRYDERRALQFLRFIDTFTGLDIVPFDIPQLNASVAVLRHFADQKLSMADAHNLHIMRTNRIETCWSTDRHMTLGGARIIT